MASTDDLFVLATSIGDSEQKMEGFRLVFLFALSVAQDVQESENTSTLQELHQVLITDKNTKQPKQTKVLITDEWWQTDTVF